MDAQCVAGRPAFGALAPVGTLLDFPLSVQRSGGVLSDIKHRTDRLRRRLARLSVVVFLASGMVGRAVDARPATSVAATYTFAFHDADVAQVAEEILGAALGLTYTIDPTVTGKMSFRIERRLTNAQLLAAFEAALKGSDIAMVRQGDALVLEPRAKAKTSGGLTTLGAGGVHGVGYETLAVPLSYALPSEVAKALQAVAPADMVVYVDDKQGLLILGGDTTDLDAALHMVRTFDRSGLEESKIRFFELSQGQADTVAGDLDKVLLAGAVSGVTVVPLKRLNGLFVFARTVRSLDEVANWVAKLDTPSKESANGFYAYHPRNVSAEDLTNALLSVLTGRASPTAAGSGGGRPSGFSQSPLSNFGGSEHANGVGGGVAQPSAARPIDSPNTAAPGGGGDGVAPDGLRIGFDRGSNTVLVLAPPARWVQIQKILEEIDHAPSQVLIEASILEVTLSDQSNFGIDWSFVAAGGQVQASSINSLSGKVSATTPGFSVTVMGKNLQAAIHALQASGSVEVVSNPKIVALDNHSAQLEVGDQVPVVTQSGQSTSSPGSPVINSVDYRNTGVILSVTPRISGDRINLDIDQEVSSVTPTSSSSINSPTIQQRRLHTTLILENEGLVAIGGLISSSRSNNRSGLPYVNSIPGLGLLFRSAGKNAARTELVVLITAKIINDKASSGRAMADLFNDMKEIERRGLLKP